MRHSSIALTGFFCFLFASSFAQAQSVAGRGLRQQVISTGTFYFNGAGVEFRVSPESSTMCRVSIPDPTQATVIGETDNMVHLAFSNNNPFSGCYLRGGNPNEGWVRKEDIYEMPTLPDNEVHTGPDMQPERVIPEITVRPRRSQGIDCARSANPQLDQARLDAAAIREACRTDKLKDAASVDRYLACYPPGEPGNSFYPQLSPLLDQAAQTFKIELRGRHYTVDPTLLRCLLRRESKFDHKLSSHTGATGLGQQIEQNRRHQQTRLNAPNSWEKKLWDQFFKQAEATPEGRKLLALCPRHPPRMMTRDDSRCPLNSLAAASLDILRIQQALVMSSGQQSARSDSINYQLAIGMSYNLGIGDGARGVRGRALESWPNSVLAKYSSHRAAEGRGHMESLRNCMAQDNYQPMAGDRARRCEGAPAATSGAPLPPADPRRSR